ncbi:MAG: peptidoglycan DD-metalloendopeptidase family protein [Candidatus Cloacimonetes bacterium]|nr:peptidoglycan DD-metalloendopeptidase family protein [Candidatus Cloacimonadota bacterium]
MNGKKIVRFILLVICFCYCQIYAQNLQDKKEQLENLKDEINKQEELIKETERKKEKTEKDLDSTLQKKRDSEKEIKSLRESELVAREKLDNTMLQIKSTNVELDQLHILCEKVFNNLFFNHYHSLIDTDKQAENYVLAGLLMNTAENIYAKEGKINELESIRYRNSQEYEDYIWSSIVAKKKNKAIVTQISELKASIGNYDLERQKAIERKMELEKEAAALDELITKLQADITTDQFSYKFSTPRLIWPVRGEIIRNFGLQKSDQYKVSLRNDGIDIGVAEGTPIVAVEDGEVAFAEWYNGAGKLVIINHKNGFYSLYSHNSILMVSKGDRVYKNQQIAFSGKTGSVEIPCLHFELRKRGTPVNPLEYLE